MRIDLRSDTMTRPTKAMLEAMMQAPVGDDVFGEDPTVNLLESRMAALFGMEAAIYCPTGTMSNQIAIKAHTHPGDELICESTAHIYQYEGGGIAFNSGVQVRPVTGDQGRFNAAQAAAFINPDDVHKARTSVIAIENTSNRGGGSCYDLNEIRLLRDLCDQHQLIFHLDGARLWNAMVATGTSAEAFGELFHSISVCLNKGLGCPIGSVLLGGKGFIKNARRIRKVFGGGMRQAGYMAAAGIFALDQHIGRLAEDHRHAAAIAAALEEQAYIEKVLPVSTNIIIAAVKGPHTASALVQQLKERDIQVLAISPSEIRMVLHLDVTAEMVEKTIEVVRSIRMK